MLLSSVDCLYYKHLFPHPLPLLHFLETQYYIHLTDLLRVGHRLFWHEPRRRIQAGWRSMKEAGMYRNRMVHALFPPLPFCIKQTIWRRWNKSSCYICFCITFFAIMICTYSLSSGSSLSMINHCFVCRCLDYFHLPSFLVPCWIFFILVISGWSLKEAISTVDLHTASKPFR